MKDLVSHIGLQFLAWTSLSVFLVLFSAGFVHVLAPQVHQVVSTRVHIVVSTHVHKVLTPHVHKVLTPRVHKVVHVH